MRPAIRPLVLFCISALCTAAFAAVAFAEPLTLEVAHAAGALDQRNRQVSVSVAVSEASKARLADFTGQNVGRKIEFRINGKVVMAPVIREPILGGTFLISVQTVREAQGIVDQLPAGAKIDIEVAPD
jgi:preprotein translocase subunit SecD